MRLCSIAPTTCRHRYSTPCCRDCREADCEGRCLNDPSRCGCWADKPPRQKMPDSHRGKIDREQIYRLRQQGLSQREIAERVGCCPTTVSNALHERGISQYGKS